MNELVRGYARAAFETAEAAEGLDQVRGDINGFARALTSSAELRTVLTDPLIPTQTRRAIVLDLLETRASAESTALLSFAVRVERASELPVTVATVGELCEDELRRFRRSEEIDVEPGAGRMAVRERIRGYSERVLQELEALGEVDVVEDELFNAAQVIWENRPLLEVLSDGNLSYSGRAAVLGDLFGRSCRPATLRLLRYTLRAGRLRDLVGTLEWIAELAAEERGRRIAEVRSAVTLSDEERERVRVALSRLVERQVEVRDMIDPGVIGGVLVSVGDLIIDGTVRLRFERLRDALAKAS
jgi:F-type H+-transporting ATPase subunit delta